MTNAETFTSRYFVAAAQRADEWGYGIVALAPITADRTQGVAILATDQERRQPFMLVDLEFPVMPEARDLLAIGSDLVCDIQGGKQYATLQEALIDFNDCISDTPDSLFRQ